MTGPAAEDRVEQTSGSNTFALRLAATCVVLVGVAMVQSAGLVVPDTKMDLAQAPGTFLGRALHVWDDLGAFGQLQNQAYGYLWPMGPFFWLGDLVGLPAWVVQRLWVALVLCVAMVGAARLARALGVRSDLACIVAALAYALSPRMLTTLGPISIEAWPSALAPWVLLPLVIGSREGSPRRAAALSALAVAMVGGVNAAATSAVLPLGVLWVLTRSAGPRRRALMIWWPLFTLLGTLWWLVPLFVLGAYSPPFLDFIESASVTTFPTTVYDALRGTSAWVPYLDGSWRAGNDLLTKFYLQLNSGVLLFLGAAGIVHRRNPHRLFLALGVAAGLVLVTMGHRGVVEGWFADDLFVLLDAGLAPVRNVHKFDPVVRLPMILGLAWLLDAMLERARERRAAVAGGGGATAVLDLLRTRVLLGTAVLAVIGAALPVAAERLTPGGGFGQVPGYWTDAAEWLDARGGSATSLVVPGSSHGQYVWGSPRDEPMQWLATTPWAIRNAIPLAPPGNIRMLDAVEDRLSQGDGSAGLAGHLRRAGVRYLVVRNDLAPSAGAPDPVLVHQALEQAPGLRRVQTFGPEIGGEAHLEPDQGRILVNGGWQNEYPALEVYEVAGEVPRAVVADEPPVVVGGPEDLLDLATLGVLEDEPTILAADAEDGPGTSPWFLTDGLRLTERHFGRVHDGRSATFGVDDPPRVGNPTRDYVLGQNSRWSTVARLEGVDAVLASSSLADAQATGGAAPGHLPFAAMDGRPSTWWTADARNGGAAWWEVRLPGTRVVDAVTLRAGPQPETVVVRTEGGATDRIRVGPRRTRVVELDGEPTRWLRVADASGRGGHQMSLAEVHVPGVRARRSLTLPEPPAEWGAPDAVVLRAVTDARTGCVEVDRAVRCVPGREGSSEEPLGFNRDLRLGAPMQVGATDMRVQGNVGPELLERLLDGLPVGVSSSSYGVADMRASALAAVDGDPGTTWTASLGDLRPVLSLNWLGRRRIDALKLTVASDSAARLPTELLLVWPGGQREVELDDDGEVSFRPIRTDVLTVVVREAESATNLSFRGVASPVAVGISELELMGLEELLPVAMPRTEERFPCGSGPSLELDGRVYQTSVRASRQELYDGATVRAELCGAGDLRLGQGLERVDLTASPIFVPTSLVMWGAAADSGTASQPVGVPVTREGPGVLALEPEDGDGAGALLALRSNANPGWRATQDGQTLDAVTVDGWQQGWRLATDDAPVTARFGPDRVYRAGILLGGLGLLALVVVALLPRSRWSARDDGPLGAVALPAPVVVTLALVGSGVLAGWWGVLAGVVGVVLGRLSSRWPDVAPFALASLVLPAAAAYAVRPWGSASGWAGDLAWPQYVVVALCAGLLAAAGGGPLRLPRSFSRIPGFSTNR